MPQKIHPVAERYGMLRPVEYRLGEGWVCICDCGVVTTVLGSNLRAGNSISCGCHRRERAKSNIRKAIQKNRELTNRGELWGVMKLQAEKQRYVPRPVFLLTQNKRRRKGNPCWLCRRPARSMLCERCNGGHLEQSDGQG